MANKILQIPEPAITWLATGGTNDFTPTSLAVDAGHQGALHDFGASAHARRYTWRAWCKFASAPTVGDIVEVYWKSSDLITLGHPDNDDGTGDIALSAEDKLRNLQPLGVIQVDEALTTVEMVGHRSMFVDSRYGGPVFFNRTSVALSATAADMGFQLIAMVDEIQ